MGVIAQFIDSEEKTYLVRLFRLYRFHSDVNPRLSRTNSKPSFRQWFKLLDNVWRLATKLVPEIFSMSSKLSSSWYVRTLSVNYIFSNKMFTGSPSTKQGHPWSCWILTPLRWKPCLWKRPQNPRIERPQLDCPIVCRAPLAYFLMLNTSLQQKIQIAEFRPRTLNPWAFDASNYRGRAWRRRWGCSFTSMLLR